MNNLIAISRRIFVLAITGFWIFFLSGSITAEEMVEIESELLDYRSRIVRGHLWLVYHSELLDGRQPPPSVFELKFDGNAMLTREFRVETDADIERAMSGKLKALRSSLLTENYFARYGNEGDPGATALKVVATDLLDQTEENDLLIPPRRIGLVPASLAVLSRMRDNEYLGRRTRSNTTIKTVSTEPNWRFRSIMIGPEVRLVRAQFLRKGMGQRSRLRV